MAFSLYPAYFRLQYSVAGSLHFMNVPIMNLEVLAPADAITVYPHLGLPISLDDMVNGFVDLLAPFYVAADTFDRYEVFTLASPTSDPISRGLVTLTAKVGTGDAGDLGWKGAVQTTITIRSANNGIFRLQLMESGSFDDFSLVTNLATIPAVEDLVNFVCDESNGFRARDGGQPTTFLQMAKTLNEKLRRQRRLV